MKQYLNNYYELYYETGACPIELERAAINRACRRGTHIEAAIYVEARELDLVVALGVVGQQVLVLVDDDGAAASFGE
jgi:hypothetical protein